MITITDIICSYVRDKEHEVHLVLIADTDKVGTHRLTAGTCVGLSFFF